MKDNYQEWYRSMKEIHEIQNYETIARSENKSLEQWFNEEIANNLTSQQILPNELLLEAYNKMRELAYLCDFNCQQLANWLNSGRKGRCNSITLDG